MKKVLLLVAIVMLSTPALAKKDIEVSYSNTGNTANDLATTYVAIEGKVLEHNKRDFRIGVANEDTSDGILKIDRTIFGLSSSEITDGLAHKIGFGIIKADLSLWSYKESIDGILLDGYVKQEINMDSFYIKPQFSYEYQSYSKSKLFSTLNSTIIQFGTDIYAIKSETEFGMYLGYKRIKNKMITKQKVNISNDPEWDLVIRPYVKYTIENNAQIALSYEQIRYKSGEKSNTIAINLGYDF